MCKNYINSCTMASIFTTKFYVVTPFVFLDYSLLVAKTTSFVFAILTLELSCILYVQYSSTSSSYSWRFFIALFSVPAICRFLYIRQKC